jgi:predicted kinase
MSDLTLTCMRGYPGSGKSTRARQIAKGTGAVVVCRDDLRLMLHGVYWDGRHAHENGVSIAEHAQVDALLKSGRSVVVDATHLRAKYLRAWAKLAAKRGAAFRIENVLTDVDECVHRDRVRALSGGRYVGGDVIHKLAEKFPVDRWPDLEADKPFTPEPVEIVPALPWAILVDIDGTLAHMTGRSPYDYDAVHTDEVDVQIRWLLNQIWDADETPPRTIIMSGRPDTRRKATEDWLALQGVLYDELHMRPAGAVDARGNQLPDYVVKHDLFNEHIRGRYNVRFVLDDRQQVVDLWRAMGLKCLQVAEGDF